MRYIEEFRNPLHAEALCQKIKQAIQPRRHYRLMEFCGGHTHAIHRYGLQTLLPEQIEFIHGPGCPVCVLPVNRINQAIALAEMPDVIFCSYADMLRVPATGGDSLMLAKARGADIRMVYSVSDALEIAASNPQKEVIFFAIGFETTTPPTADAILRARRENIGNFTVFCNHVLTPVAMAALLQHQQQEQSPIALDGFIGPAHVSIVIGSQAYQKVSRTYRKPIVIAGFEPLDMLHSVLWLVEMINEKQVAVKTQYTRAVTAEGNLRAQALMDETFELRSSFAWRGLGEIAESALKIKAEYRDLDAEERFKLPELPGEEHKQCACADILKGLKKPKDCKLFAKACTPHNPLGSCMVSSEGACAAVYAYARSE